MFQTCCCRKEALLWQHVLPLLHASTKPGCEQRGCLRASGTTKARNVALQGPALLRPLTSLGGNPIQYQQAWNNVGKDAIQGITDGVRVGIDGEKHLDAKGHDEYHQHDALPCTRIIDPAPLSKPRFFHAVCSSCLQTTCCSSASILFFMSLVKHSSARGADPSLCALGTGYSGFFNRLGGFWENGSSLKSHLRDRQSTGASYHEQRPWPEPMTTLPLADG